MRPAKKSGVKSGRLSKAVLDKFPSLRFSPDRRTLTVAEVAYKLRITKQHAINLIEEGILEATESENGGRYKTTRYRITVKQYERFLLKRLSPGP